MYSNEAKRDIFLPVEVEYYYIEQTNVIATLIPVINQWINKLTVEGYKSTFKPINQVGPKQITPRT